MTVVTKSDVVKISRLARLKLSEEEIGKYTKDLERILEYVEELRDINVDNVAPMCHAFANVAPFREDEAKKTLGRECLESSAGYEDGLIRVPKIIE